MHADDVEGHNITSTNEEESMRFLGYSGRVGRISFRLKYLRSWLLHSIAYSSPHPGLVISLQRARGVEIGRNCYIGPYVLIDLIHPNMVKIGDNVAIGINSMIFAHSVANTNPFLKSRGYGRTVNQVTIKSGAIIYAGSIITAGVTIGKNSMISIGSVVLQSVPDNSIAMGNPARIVKKIL